MNYLITHVHKKLIKMLSQYYHELLGKIKKNE